MSGSDATQSRSGSFAASDATGMLERFTHPVPLVGLVTVFALALRLVGLGTRVAHQDEARVAYWIARYVETGIWSYRPIVHGPFLVHVNSVLFSLFGASDFTMRLIVALAGGLLPLSAVLFRRRLRDSETVALALLLATNPILLYYSRFMRNDVLLAAAMLFALGFFVRAYDTGGTRRAGYFFVGVACFALGFTMKENALLYAACWGGAAVLLYDHRLFLRRVGNDGVAAAFPDWSRRGASRLRDGDRSVLRRPLVYLGVGLLGILEFFTIIVFFYAPRSQGQAGPGLWKALGRGDAWMFLAVVDEAIFGTWRKFMGSWAGGHQSHPYLPFLEHHLGVIEVGALALVVLAVVGFLVDRYSGERPSDLVSFGFYWGFASVLGYPLVMDIKAAWAVVHAVVPLAIPAAVALALVFRWGWDGYQRDDDLSVVAAVLLLLLVGAQVGTAAYSTTYQNPQSPDNELVQYAQSSTEMDALLSDLQDVARENEGTDVLYYGEKFYAGNEAGHDVPPATGGWFARLPLEWYFEAADAEVTSTRDPSDLVGEKPPIVVALGDASTCNSEEDVADDVDRYMKGYVRYDVQRFGYDSGCTVSSVVIFVDQDALPADAPKPGTFG
ncbi:flippase activity-associated protein Agl23 [Halomicrococcus sp. SG-WS-1]|uniref:flippase activity-associated protein Agl23 n=1 Tax=Halomicrococcus sp. SG-WS-1 TaxID=3439057 RepID=UPI003F7B020E